MQSHARLKPLQPRAEQKLQTRHALMDAARSLMGSGRGFGSLSLREVARCAGIVPTGFYRHFEDMDALGLALIAEVGETFRETIRQVRHHEFEVGGVIDASVRIFLDAVAANRSQFLFLAASSTAARCWYARPWARCANASPPTWWRILRPCRNCNTSTPRRRT